MNLLNALLRDPQVVRNWQAAEWNQLLPLARSARLLGRCLSLFEQHDLVDAVPPRIVDQLRGALIKTRFLHVQALRELRHVVRVLDRAAIESAALKGVAYLAADLPPRGWRSLSDIDLLVREVDIARAESALQRAGWVPNGEFDDYDQHYYREWMHEIPPLRHSKREIEVDLHHNLAPPVSRIVIDADRLWHAARTVSDGHGFAIKVLAPADMLLHNALHLFMNDELRGGLRDVVDFRDLYEHFRAEDSDFDHTLVARAQALGCERPLYYAVTTGQRLAGLQPSPTLREAVAHAGPPAPVAALMAWLIEHALAPGRLGLRRTRVANGLLFIRSHWVRMPPRMLLRHLGHKLLLRRKPPAPEPDLPG
ncbi:MAG: nucleotidyltransferase family protein [Gammaproteobacteria bacterium]|nr:nucleotidyltransferase family protein [Gammaproteobacteria bacterium]